MSVAIFNMNSNQLMEYTNLFVSVFNSEPWNDSWTEKTAMTRIENMMKTNTFIGKAIFCDNDLKGVIWGQKEQSYDGIHFHIQEFCVKTMEQNKGYGKALLNALREELSSIGVTSTYLITSRGERTEAYYKKRGFFTSDNMILMTDSYK